MHFVECIVLTGFGHASHAFCNENECVCFLSTLKSIRICEINACCWFIKLCYMFLLPCCFFFLRLFCKRSHEWGQKRQQIINIRNLIAKTSFFSIVSFILWCFHTVLCSLLVFFCCCYLFCFVSFSFHLTLGCV